MDYELRNLKDFLGLYNKVTELCFTACVDNFFGRDLSPGEIRCSEACVGKFTNVNQRLMQVYVGVQGAINQRRMVEFEEQQAKLLEAQQQQLQQQQQEQSPAPAETASSVVTVETPDAGTADVK
ncbi:mitochondrial import inner membrane translocase subunit Tim10B [Wyeomyia smithii]|uniref:mitochondrial import inner membrane translocase subunit Tim10B n=1 Tax=Wyeomyia smithii TaxID=174621 RepID=UPI002467BDE6|nr:mitochondrial import inner membrane translocase subunit Tim10B [Wyeomyia smithii]